jgi:beta-glucosidase
VAESAGEAARLALKSGIDIDMMTSCYANHLKRLAEEDEELRGSIDEAVSRILRLKEDLGLFSNPYGAADPEKAEQVFLYGDFRKAAREIAVKSMVLLKNEGILPLGRDKKIALIGPFADNPDILGDWHALGKPEDAATLLSGIRGKVGSSNVAAEKGCGIESLDRCGFKKARAAAAEADVVILALGEEQSMTGEDASRAFITLPGVQQALAEDIFKLGKPVVVVLFNGRPLEIAELADRATAVLEAWFPGTEGGNAAADILFGDVNPSGRLTMSFPYTAGQIPVYYNCFNTGRPKMEGKEGRSMYSRFIDIPNEPLYPFGFGLNYSSFEYGSLSISGDTLKMGEELNVSVILKNACAITGTETVQLYIRDLVGKTIRPVKELKGFKQVTLAPGEERAVEFIITPDMLRYHDPQGNYIVEAGEFLAMVGGNSRDVKAVGFRLE